MEERGTWPDHERRIGDTPDTSRRRRRTDSELWEAFEGHIAESRVWRVGQEVRVKNAEEAARNLAALLDGREGNDGGIIGAIAALQTDLKLLRADVKDLGGDVKDLKAKTGTKDGQKPPGRFERTMTIAGPILVVLITTIGGIVIAYFALRGQLAGLNSGGGVGR